MDTTTGFDRPRSPHVRPQGGQRHRLRPETSRLLVDLLGELDAGSATVPVRRDLPEVAGGGADGTRQCGTAAGVADVRSEVHGAEGSSMLTPLASLSLAVRRLAACYHHEMRPVRDIRRENLARLVRDMGGPTKFGAFLDPDRAKTKKSQVQQWLMAPGMPTARNLGDRTARHIEGLLDKPPGWLDTDHGDARDNFSDSASQLLRPDPEILHTALIQLEGETAVGAAYPGMALARRLADLYQLVLQDGGRLAAATNAREMAKAIARGRAREEMKDVRNDDRGSGNKDQRGAAASE